MATFGIHLDYQCESHSEPQVENDHDDGRQQGRRAEQVGVEEQDWDNQNQSANL